MSSDSSTVASSSMPDVGLTAEVAGVDDLFGRFADKIASATITHLRTLDIAEIKARLDELEAKKEKKAKRQKFTRGAMEIMETELRLLRVDVERSKIFMDARRQEIDHLVKMNTSMKQEIERLSEIVENLKPTFPLSNEF